MLWEQLSHAPASHHAWPTTMDCLPPNCDSSQTISSLSCLCEKFCHVNSENNYITTLDTLCNLVCVGGCTLKVAAESLFCGTGTTDVVSSPLSGGPGVWDVFCVCFSWGPQKVICNTLLFWHPLQHSRKGHRVTTDIHRQH